MSIVPILVTVARTHIESGLSKILGELSAITGDSKVGARKLPCSRDRASLEMRLCEIAWNANRRPRRNVEEDKERTLEQANERTRLDHSKNMTAEPHLDADPMLDSGPLSRPFIIHLCFGPNLCAMAVYKAMHTPAFSPTHNTYIPPPLRIRSSDHSVS